MRPTPSWETFPGFNLCLRRASLWDHARSVRQGWARGHILLSAQLFSPGSWGSWTPGTAEQKAETRSPECSCPPPVPSFSFIFQYITWVCSSEHPHHLICSLLCFKRGWCWVLWVFLIARTALLKLSCSIAAIARWAAGTRLPLRQHPSPFRTFNSEDFGADFPSLPVLCYID